MKRGGQTRRDAIEGVSQAAFARRKGVSRQAVRAAIEAGRIKFIRGTKRIDPRTAGRAWDENSDASKRRAQTGADPPARGRRAAPGEGPTLNESKTRRETALAALAELELEQARGDLVRKADVASMASVCARRTKDAVLAVPANVVDQLEVLGLSDVVSGQRILTEALTRALEGVAGELAADVDAPPAASEAKAS